MTSWWTRETSSVQLEDGGAKLTYRVVEIVDRSLKSPHNLCAAGEANLLSVAHLNDWLPAEGRCLEGWIAHVMESTSGRGVSALFIGW